MTVNGLQDTDQYCYFAHYRPWPINTRRKLEMVIHLDSHFLAEQAAEGKLTKDLECLIARFQQMEAADVERAEEKTRREQQAVAEKLRKKEEADQRQADKLAKAVSTAAKAMLQEMLKDLVSSGVLRHGK